MIQLRTHGKRAVALATSMALACAAMVPALVVSRAHAAQITNRSITMSTSKWSAPDVTYTVAFTTASTGTIQGLVIEFCDGSPVIGDPTCATPTGFDINKATLAFSTTMAGGAFALNSGLSDANTAIFTRTDATSITTATAETFTLGGAGGSDGITNPSLGNHTFYARIFTYVDNDDDSDGCSAVDDNATCYTSAAPNVYLDAGGIALSTTNDLVITAKVQERLRFCISTVVSADCTTAGTQKDTTTTNRTVSVNLGDTNGVLDTTGAYVNSNVRMYIQTNALYKATVVVKGTVPTSGTNYISYSGTNSTGSGTGAVAGTGYAYNNGGGTPVEQFGFCVTTDAGVTVSAPYGDGVINTDTATGCASAPNNSGSGTVDVTTATKYGYDIPNVVGNGSTVLTKAAGPVSVLKISFMGVVANTTEAGLYQSNLQYIATGQY